MAPAPASTRATRAVSGGPSVGIGSTAWVAAEAVTVGIQRRAPDGSWISSTAARTTRATFDATDMGGGEKWRVDLEDAVVRGAIVLREGELLRIATEDVVRGDIVLIDPIE